MKNEETRKKLDELMDDSPSQWGKNTRERIKNKGRLLKSAYVALQILDALKEKGITKTELAERMDVSRQWVNEIVKGKQNLTLEVIDQLEIALEIEIELHEKIKNVGDAGWLRSEVKSMAYTGIETRLAQAMSVKIDNANYVQYSRAPLRPWMIIGLTQPITKTGATYSQGSFVMQTNFKKLQESYDTE